MDDYEKREILDDINSLRKIIYDQQSLLDEILSELAIVKKKPKSKKITRSDADW